jgi:DNA-binding protein H-NS
MFKDVGRETFGILHCESASPIIQALKRETWSGRGRAGPTAKFLNQNSSLKTLADEVKEAIKESRRHRKLTQDEVEELLQMIKVVGPSPQPSSRPSSITIITIYLLPETWTKPRRCGGAQGALRSRALT